MYMHIGTHILSSVYMVCCSLGQLLGLVFKIFLFIQMFFYLSFIQLPMKWYNMHYFGFAGTFNLQSY